ncbi:serine/threonine-protein phosphatase [Caloramator sp. E03]|uniref:SpoIIE family protein phosphatase n=1 Tax=Caloramator sp. E03 TaxID=2576307 RepID=UPI0011105B62|nr:SpoIIE family protein phosphatase [Caloramator sp. E03]QCX34146.1 serine/threonine-protein phosphatase [Caloramator sp. E03]
MSFFIDADYESINKYNEELCGDRVEIIRNKDSIVVVLADGLGSGVKANILSTLTSKIIGTMLSKGSSIDEAVETIAKTLPVCKERGIAYSTFSILEIFNNGEGYLVEFDNPSIIRLKNGKYVQLLKNQRIVYDKKIYETRFKIDLDDTFIMISDGAVHAGIGQLLNLGWQWENIKEYTERMYKKELSAKSFARLLVSVCDNLYGQKPGDDTTVAVVRVRKAQNMNILIGPPADKELDNYVVNKFISSTGKKIVCGGTTSQIVCRVLNRELKVNLNYINPAIPPTAEIDGIDLTCEGVLTISKALEHVKRYISSKDASHNFFYLEKGDGASRLAKMLIEEGTSIHFFVGRAINPAHQNPEFPLDLGLKLKLVNDMVEYLKLLGKEVIVDYF